MHRSVSGEFGEVFQYSVSYRFRILAASCQQGMSHVVASEFFLPRVGLIGDAVGVEDYKVPGMGIKVNLFVLSIVQQSGGNATDLGLNEFTFAADHGRCATGVGHHEAA